MDLSLRRLSLAGMLRPLIRLLRWLATRLHGLYRALGLFLVIALILALGGLWVFAEIAGDVMSGQTARFDEAILQWMHAHGTSSLDKWALQITAIGNGASVIALGLVLCGFLWVLRYRLAVLLLVMGVFGADLGNRVLKSTFDRPRPELFVIDTPHARPTSGSFPSGHATAAMALFLIVAYLLSKLGGRGVFRVASIGLAVALILAIGVSRVYLGVHYPSDVIAGFLFGFVWVNLCIFGLEAVRVIRGRSQARGAVLKGADTTG
ncbi:MAG TPA: phosphatase PAP2 family protein [Gemmatimonadales bacterium]